MDAIRVLVVDRQRAVAQTIARSLDAEPELAVVGRAQSAPEAEREAAVMRPDVIVLDETIANGELTDLVERLRGRNPAVKLVVTSPRGDAATACASVRAGASAFVLKVGTIEEMVSAVRGAVRGESWIPPLLLTGVLAELRAGERSPREDLRISRLTERERQVLAGMMAGLDRARIAQELILSVNTVRTHTQNILTKLEVHSSLQAVGLALATGFRPALTPGSGPTRPSWTPSSRVARPRERTPREVTSG